MEGIPNTGFKGLVQNWKSDLIAAVSVALIALPLSLGIALAAGAPAMAGIFSAVVGGVVTTFYRGGHISVNGPAKGVIGVILLGIVLLDDGSGQAFNYVLAAIVVSGALQTLLGIFKLGRIADIFHGSVIQGLLAAIGIIIFAKQIHVALGTHSDGSNIVENLVDAVRMLPEANPFVVLISLAGLLMILYNSKITNRFFHFLPVPMWVIVLSIPFVYLFNFFEQHEISLLGKNFTVGPELLLDIPDSITESIMHPNFGKIGTLEFWSIVFSLLIITSIEHLAIAKAVDKIDPYKRKTDLNKDLTGIGLSTMISGFLGGLPIISVIIRSTVNIHNGAKTKWSNMYQGLLLLLFIVVLSPVMRQVPLCAFAILLVHTGFKLASPAVFKQVYNQGIEQLVFFLATMIMTLYSNLLVGLLGGSFLVLVTHILLARIPVPQFFKLVYSSRTRLISLPDGSFILKVRGIANFLGIIKVDKLVANIPADANINIDLSETRLVDMSYMDYIVEFLNKQRESGGKVFISGLDRHISSSTYNKALKFIVTGESVKLNHRQKRLRNLATERGYSYSREVNWNTSYLKQFHFFEVRPIERKYNCLVGGYPELDVSWEIADVIFNEGQAFTAETINSTVMVLKLNRSLPIFTMEKERAYEKLFDRVIAFTGYRDLEFQLFSKFSKKLMIMGNNEDELQSFFTPEVVQFFEEHQISHIESNGESLLIFNKLKLARTDETIEFIDYGLELTHLLNATAKA
jgi:MFS superfamily sulfate permease-like transporter